MESSRIFIRGLPPKLTEDEVRKHFAKFPVTDVRYFRERRIAYVGYEKPSEAAQAVKYFNKTFIRMSKIFVEIARPFSDKSLHKSRRQQRAEKSVPSTTEYIPPPKENNLKRKRADDEGEQDPKLKEFLDVMQPRSKANTWANDDAQPVAEAKPAAETEEQATAPDGESDGEYQVITKKAITQQRQERHSTEPEIMQMASEQQPAQSDEDTDMQDAIQDPGNSTVNEQVPASDADWLRSRTNRVLDLVDDDEDSSRPVVKQPPENTEDEGEEGEQQHEPADMEVDEPQHEEAATPSEEDKIRKTGRLYLRNLHYDITSDHLLEQFSKYGAIEEIHVPMKKGDGKGKGFAFVSYQNPEHAVNAFSRNDGTIFQGRLLHIISAESKRNAKLDEFEIAKLPLKKQREIRRKADAAGSSWNWNSLYMNADAVMSTVADRLGVSKQELLDPTSSDAAVKQAHAETHIIQEIKSYFATNGVDLEAFKRSAKGDTAILVKNIPHGTGPDEVRKLFEEHGTIKKFLMPPAGMTAIVEFSNSAQAKSAYASLAYRKIKDSILYLEKAPKELFSSTQPVPAASTTMYTGTTKVSAADLLQDAPEQEIPNTSTLYVRNLNFTTTTQRLTETFSPLNGFRSARVKTRTDPKRGVLSMGFGFVEFISSAAASTALSTMNGYNLDGHRLEIKASHQGADAAEERRREDAAKKAAGTKIIIKNLPFEAGKKDVRALFSPYGTLRSVRVPKKFDSTSRGFAFIEFATKRDAVNAVDALRNTHLLGRRLALAFAETEPDDPEQELEKMQQKVGAQANKVALQRLTGGGRKKFNVAGNDDDLDEA